MDAKKWIIFTVLLILGFLIWLVVCAFAEDLFFMDYDIIAVKPNPVGYLEFTVQNPDSEGEIKVVKVAVYEGKVLAFWYLDRFKNGFVFTLENGSYQRNAEAEKKCLGCHNTPT